MKKLGIILFILITGCLIFSNDFAVRSDGSVVELLNDGTWKEYEIETDDGLIQMEIGVPYLVEQYGEKYLVTVEKIERTRNEYSFYFIVNNKSSETKIFNNFFVEATDINYYSVSNDIMDSTNTGDIRINGTKRCIFVYPTKKDLIELNIYGTYFDLTNTPIINK